MFAWLKRVAIYAWRVLDAMAESGGPWPELEHQHGRIARLEARVAELEAGSTGAGGRPARVE